MTIDMLAAQDLRRAAAPLARGLRRSSPEGRRASLLADAWTGLPEGVTRWRLAAAVRAAARTLDVTSPMLRLLEHYIDLSYDQDWAAGSEPVICRPLAEIADHLGRSERQVRNIERALMERGLLAFRDSGNHAATGRRDRYSGRLVYAYGPTLAPLGARALEIIALAAEARAAIAETRRLRLAVSALRRRIRADIGAAKDLGLDVTASIRAMDECASRIPDGTAQPWLAALRDRLAAVADALLHSLGGSCPDDARWNFPAGSFEPPFH